MASHIYDFGKADDLRDFQRILALALSETSARRLIPNLYRGTTDGSIGRVSGAELAEMVATALRREVGGENYYSRPGA